MLDFSGLPIDEAAETADVSSPPPQQSAGPEVLQQSPVPPSQQSFVVEAAVSDSEAPVSVSAVVPVVAADEVFDFDELELLSPAQPVSREREASIDTILNLLFIFITFHI